MVELAAAAAYNDLASVELFRVGAPLYGLLAGCCLGEAVEHVAPEPLDELRADCARSNRQLLKQLVEAEHAGELLALTRADAEMGRMSQPAPADADSLDAVRLCPRFAVVQGEHEDGRPKIRPVDHFSWSAPAEGAPRRAGKRRMKEDSINGHTVLPEKLAYDHIDGLIDVARQFLTDMEVCPVCACCGPGVALHLLCGGLVVAGGSRPLEGRHQGGFQANPVAEGTHVGSFDCFQGGGPGGCAPILLCNVPSTSVGMARGLGVDTPCVPFRSLIFGACLGAHREVGDHLGTQSAPLAIVEICR